MAASIYSDRPRVKNEGRMRGNWRQMRRINQALGISAQWPEIATRDKKGQEASVMNSSFLLTIDKAENILRFVDSRGGT